MGTYAKRTCVHCGIRKPQPEMYQEEIYTETGKSQTGISGLTWIGVFSGDKKSGSQVRNWLFNSGQRTYKRKRLVWTCGNCSNNSSQPSEPSLSRKAKLFWLGFFVLLVISNVLLDDGKSNNTPTTTTQTSP
jgi:hypothetical protein